MQSCISILLGLVLSLSVGAEPLVEGHVRLESGQPVAGAQVRLFDLADLAAGPIAETTTDATGSFALSFAGAGQARPQGFALGQNYPNPFNPSTVIPYHLPTAMPVQLAVFNLLGQRVATLVAGERAAGAHTAHWDGTNAAGQAVAAGMYLYRLSGEGVQATRSMVLIDGQAGIPAVSLGALPQAGAEATEGALVYGLTVSGPGLMPFVDPAFRVGDQVTVGLVVEASVGLSRAKIAFAGGVLGDVDNNGRVDVFDALLVALYSGDSSIVMPNNGDISLGDVNADGRIDSTDAYLIAGWLTDPSDPTLPAGIGEGGAGSSDYDALKVLYEVTDGANWTNNADWLSDKPLGEWFGVTTDANGRVTHLELANNGLSGVLPSSLGDLTHLQELVFFNNALSGALPSSLGALTHLKLLWLGRNQLSGSLPSWLGNLINLERLWLGYNQLSGALPSSLCNLINLEELNLSDMQLCAPSAASFQRWLDGVDDKEGVVDCPEFTEEGDRAQLAEMLREIDALIGDAVGASIEDCRYVGLGSKPCGGPWEYIVYSVSSTDSTALAERLAAYEAFEDEMNRRYMYVSDCSVPNEPVLVYKDGRCLAE